MQKPKHSCGGLARERMHVSDHSWIVTDVFGLQRVNELEEFFGDMGQGYTVGLAFRSRRGCGQKVGLPKEGVHKGCTQKSRKRMLWQSMKGQAR